MYIRVCVYIHTHINVNRLCYNTVKHTQSLNILSTVTKSVTLWLIWSSLIVLIIKMVKIIDNAVGQVRGCI